jgi:glycosyltransferase involved in cell wall biosynthesis
VLFVGGLRHIKGVHVLIEAMKELKDIPLVIVGDGVERKQLERAADGMNIEFVGHVQPDQIRNLMIERGRTLVLPSIAWEGMPNVVLEAMSVGLPVIATDVAGVREILEDGALGVVVPPNDVQALRSSVRRVWTDGSFRSLLAERGRSASAKYSWQNVASMWSEVLAAVVAQKRS